MTRKPDPVSPEFIQRLNDSGFVKVTDDPELESPFAPEDYEESPPPGDDADDDEPKE